MGRVIKNEPRAEALRDNAASRDEAARLEARLAELDRLRGQARDQVIDLALSIARRVVGRAVELDPRHLDDIYSQAIAAAGGVKCGSIRVHPSDREASAVDELAKKAGLEVVLDSSVGPSGCRIHCCDGEIDATLDAVLGALEKALRGVS